MIIERKLNSGLKQFSEVEIGACFEMPDGINYATDGPFLTFDPTCFIKTERMRWFDELDKICRVTNAIDLKTGQSMHVADDSLVRECKNVKLIIS